MLPTLVLLAIGALSLSLPLLLWALLARPPVGQQRVVVNLQRGEIAIHDYAKGTFAVVARITGSPTTLPLTVT